MVGWMGQTAAMLWSREKSLALAGNRTLAILPVAHCYTNSAVSAIILTVYETKKYLIHA
jgi:hypothetical protein